MLKATAFIPFMNAVVKLRFESYSTERLRELIDESGFTQEKIANGSGVPLSSLKNWVLGKRTPTLDSLSKLGKFFNVYFFAGWNADQSESEN